MNQFKAFLTSTALVETIEVFPGGRLDGATMVFTGGTVALKPAVRYKNNDGYRITAVKGGWRVESHRPIGFLAGLLNLAEALRTGADPAGEVVPRFMSRIYKHEANFGREWTWHRPITRLGRGFWTAFVQELVRLRFNGLVFYPSGAPGGGYHPFEGFLDYNKFDGLAKRITSCFMGPGKILPVAIMLTMRRARKSL
ncbi:MAG: hypothetical protein ABIF71_05915 [Planctomycetota bacterium]